MLCGKRKRGFGANFLVFPSSPLPLLSFLLRQQKEIYMGKQEKKRSISSSFSSPCCQSQRERISPEGIFPSFSLFFRSVQGKSIDAAEHKFDRRDPAKYRFKKRITVFLGKLICFKIETFLQHLLSATRGRIGRKERERGKTKRPS